MRQATTFDPFGSEGPGGAYLAIKRGIVELDVLPGAALVEQKLAATLDVSAASVRQALQRLCDEGLVVEGRRAYMAAPVLFKDAHDMFQVRTILEAESAGAAAERGSDFEVLVELEHLGGEGYDMGDKASVVRFVGDNTRFHVSLARFAGNPVLATTLERVLGQMERLLLLGLLQCPGQGAPEEHQELLAAVKGGDAAGARHLAAAHAASSRAMVLDALLACESPAPVRLVVLPGG